MPVQCTCVTCGAPFTVRPYRASSGKYCSRACHYAAAPPSTLLCAHCGTSFQIQQWRAARGDVQFCSTACRWAAKIPRATDGSYTFHVVDRFWSKVNRDGPIAREGLSPCWLWTGPLNRAGYGRFAIDHRHTCGAHRVAWELANGPIPEGQWVLHHCDVRACIRPDHLFTGDAQINSIDMVEKGRSAKGDRNATHLYPERLARGERHGSHLHPDQMLRGEGHPRARLTEAAVREIRAQPPAPWTELAAKYEITYWTIWDVRTGKTWKHVH